MTNPGLLASMSSTATAESMRRRRDEDVGRQLEILLGQPEQPGKPFERTCANCGQRFVTRVRDRDRCSALCRQPLSPVSYVNCVICSKLFITRGTQERKTCGYADCQREYRDMRVRNREHLRRSSVSDISPEQEAAMRKRAKKCPLCGVKLTAKSGRPNSKHLDHILPVSQGGTHTHGNCRIICRTCNLSRPKDGRDFTGQLTLWAQGPAPVSRPRKLPPPRNTETCWNGLHPWIQANIETNGGKKRCRPCRMASEEKRGVRPNLRQCKCGFMFPAPGATIMCPACVEAAARKGAELHAAGLSWQQVAEQVGYTTAEGARYAAKRIGYVPVPRPVEPKPDPRPLCRCGEPVENAIGQKVPTCTACVADSAIRAVAMRSQGMTLRAIADQLGYGSVTSVTNLLKAAPEKPLCACGEPLEAKPGKGRSVLTCPACTTAKAWRAVGMRQRGATLREIAVGLMRTVVEIKPWSRGVTLSDEELIALSTSSMRDANYSTHT